VRRQASRGVWDCTLNAAGMSQPRLNTNGRPIVNKYREGKMKRILEKGLKELEIAKEEAKSVFVPSRNTDQGV